MKASHAIGYPTKVGRNSVARWSFSFLKRRDFSLWVSWLTNGPVTFVTYLFRPHVLHFFFFLFFKMDTEVRRVIESVELTSKQNHGQRSTFSCLRLAWCQRSKWNFHGPLYLSGLHQGRVVLYHQPLRFLRPYWLFSCIRRKFRASTYASVVLVTSNTRGVVNHISTNFPFKHLMKIKGWDRKH